MLKHFPKESYEGSSISLSTMQYLKKLVFPTFSQIWADHLKNLAIFYVIRRCGGVRHFSLRRAQPSTPPHEAHSTRNALGRGFNPARADCGLQGTATSPKRFRAPRQKVFSFLPFFFSHSVKSRSEHLKGKRAAEFSTHWSTADRIH
jgi:hypothetical protein